jgi:hypothetical protein
MVNCRKAFRSSLFSPTTDQLHNCDQVGLLQKNGQQQRAGYYMLAGWLVHHNSHSALHACSTTKTHWAVTRLLHHNIHSELHNSTTPQQPFRTVPFHRATHRCYPVTFTDDYYRVTIRQGCYSSQLNQSRYTANMLGVYPTITEGGNSTLTKEGCDITTTMKG